MNGHRQEERIGPDKKLAHTALKKHKVEIAEGKFPDEKKIPGYTLRELAALYLPWAQTNHRGYVATRSRAGLLFQAFGGQSLSQITPLKVDEYISRRAATHKPATVNRDVVVLRHMFVTAMALFEP